MTIDILTIMLGFLVIFSAGLIQGATSFGFSLLALPLLGIILPLKVIVPMLVIFSLIMNSMILYKIRKYVNLKRISILTISAVIATPFGASLLNSIDEGILKVSIGIIVTITAIAFQFGFKFPVKNEKLAFIPIGLTSGVLNGSLSISGPPVILFLSNQNTDKQTFRSTLTAYFWILNLITIFIYVYNKMMTIEVIKYSGYLLPALVIGVLVGIKLGNLLKENTFKILTTILIISTGILSIITGLK